MVELKKKNKAIKTQIAELNTKIEQLEKDKKQDNLIVTRLKIDTKNSRILKEGITDFMRKIETEIRIRKAIKIRLGVKHDRGGKHKEKKSKYSTIKANYAAQDGSLY